MKLHFVSGQGIYIYLFGGSTVRSSNKFVQPIQLPKWKSHMCMHQKYAENFLIIVLYRHFS
jgi:hypothetical protein